MTEQELLRIRRRVMHHVTRQLNGIDDGKGLYATDIEAWDATIRDTTFRAFEIVIKDELKRAGRVVSKVAYKTDVS